MRLFCEWARKLWPAKADDQVSNQGGNDPHSCSLPFLLPEPFDAEQGEETTEVEMEGATE